MREGLRNKLRWSKTTLIVLVCLVVATIIAGYIFYTKPWVSSPIPSQIRSQLTFSPFVVSKEAEKKYTVTDYHFGAVEDGTKVLTYVIHAKDGTANVAVTQYTQPPQFTEVPEYKDRFLTGVIKQYATVQTANGTIFLGRLAKQSDKQVGIMLDKGLVTFLNPSKELDQAQWRSIGDSLDIQKIID